MIARRVACVPLEPLEAGFAHAHQAILCERTLTHKKSGKQTQGCRLFIVSVPMEADSWANALRMGRLVRGHWTVENNVHWLRDAVGGEDRCRARNPNIACALALLRTALLAPVRVAGYQSLTEAVEHFAATKQDAVALLKSQRLA